MRTFLIRQATECEIGTVTSLIDQAASWLRTKNTNQWEHPWPTPAGRAKRIRGDIKSGKTWLAWDGKTAAATVTIEYKQSENLPELWAPNDVGPAFSAHRLVVNRRYAGMGLGAAVLNWAGEQAAVKGCEWMRIDVWTTNRALHEYYECQGFKFVRMHRDRKYPSGALFQRAISSQQPVPGIRFEEPRARSRYRSGKMFRWVQLPDAGWLAPPAPLSPLSTVSAAMWTLGRSFRSTRRLD